MESIYCKVCRRRQPVEVARNSKVTLRIKCRRCKRWIKLTLPLASAADTAVRSKAKQPEVISATAGKPN